MKYYIRIDEEVELYQYEIFGEYVQITWCNSLLPFLGSWATFINERAPCFDGQMSYKKTLLFGL